MKELMHDKKKGRVKNIDILKKRVIYNWMNFSNFNRKSAISIDIWFQ